MKKFLAIFIFLVLWNTISAQGVLSHHSTGAIVSNTFQGVKGICPVVDFQQRVMSSTQFGGYSECNAEILNPGGSPYFSYETKGSPALFNTVTNASVFSGCSPMGGFANMYKYNNQPGHTFGFVKLAPMYPLIIFDHGTYSATQLQSKFQDSSNISGNVYFIFTGGRGSGTHPARYFGLWLWAVKDNVSANARMRPFYLRNALHWMTPLDSAKVDLLPYGGSALEHNQQAIKALGAEEASIPIVGLNTFSNSSELYYPLVITYDSTYAASAFIQKSFLWILDPDVSSIKVIELDSINSSSTTGTRTYKFYNQLSKSAGFNGHESLFLGVNAGRFISNSGYEYGRGEVKGGRIHIFRFNDSTQTITPGSFVDFLATGAVRDSLKADLAASGSGTLYIDDAEILPPNGDSVNGVLMRTILVTTHVTRSNGTLSTHSVWEVCVLFDVSGGQTIYSIKKQVSDFQFLEGHSGNAFKYMQKNGPTNVGTAGTAIHLFSPGANIKTSSLPEILTTYPIALASGEQLHGCKEELFLAVQIKYTAKLIENQYVNNQWTITGEQVAWFEIEKSHDGILWEFITSVNASNGKDYHFDDLSPFFGQSYYRVKIVLKDGQVDYSTVKTIHRTNFESNITIYPNPTSDLLTIESKAYIQEITIFNNLGQQISSQTVDEQLCTLSFEKYPKGIYFVQISFKGGITKVRQVVRQ